MRKLSIMLVILVFAVAARARAEVLSIAVARSLPAGSVVTVEGSVTVPSGDFATSTFDQGFVMEDETGGIYVSTSENLRLDFHRRVRVTGVTGDNGVGLLILTPASPADVEKLSGASRVEPAPVATGDISEATEGSLVEVTGTLTRPVIDDLPFGYQIFIDDGTGETQIFVCASTGINPLGIPFLQVGERITAVGSSGQFLAQYEILPRHRGDIRRATASSSPAPQSKQGNSSGPLELNPPLQTNGGGGIDPLGLGSSPSDTDQDGGRADRVVRSEVQPWSTLHRGQPCPPTFRKGAEAARREGSMRRPRRLWPTVSLPLNLVTGGLGSGMDPNGGMAPSATLPSATPAPGAPLNPSS